VDILFRRFSGCIFKYHMYFQRSWSKNNCKQEQCKCTLNKGVEWAYSFVLTPWSLKIYHARTCFSKLRCQIKRLNIHFSPKIYVAMLHPLIS
jgi:hypothetical protein